MDEEDLGWVAIGRCNPAHFRFLTESGRGGVWAMDYAEAPCWIDGCDRYVLAVRDLASGQQLLWLPREEATAERTLEQLACCLLATARPWCLKSDNGSNRSPSMNSVLSRRS